jgi:hypothetical protein
MGMANPIKWLWNKVSGDALWDATKWLWAAAGSAMTTLAQSVYTWAKGHPNELSLVVGVAVVLIFATGAVIVAKLQSISAKNQPLLPPLVPPPSALPPEGEIIAKDKLRLEILEGLVGPRITSAFGVQVETWILLRVRVVSSSDPAVTIKEWYLDLQTCKGSSWHQGYRNDIPSGLTFTREGDPWTRETAKSEEIDIRLDARTLTKPVAFGAAEEGWVLFRVLHNCVHHVFGAEFHLTVTDDLDNKSRCQMVPGEWLNPAVLHWS